LKQFVIAAAAKCVAPRRKLRHIKAVPRDGAGQRKEDAMQKLDNAQRKEAVLALLRRDEGATIAQISDATGWQSHTVRGFLAGLKRKGITVTVLERVRMVGPNKAGAKGSYSVYRIVK
jgi:predicted transcriptional regulator